MFDILLQNNASREIFILHQLDNVSDTNRYLEFVDVTLPDGMNDGEYSYAVIYNGRDDVVYEPNAALLRTLVKTSEGDYHLGDLKPITGILKVGKPQPLNTYNTDKEKDNKTIYYYKNGR